MVDSTLSKDATLLVRRADDLVSQGLVREAINLLTGANRSAHDAELERALVRLRRDAATARRRPAPNPRAAIVADPPGGGLFEIDAGELTVPALRAGFAQSGCVLVRGLVASDCVARLVAGIDSALAAYDAALEGGPVDPGWYSPGAMPDREGGGLPEAAHRAWLRERGGLWTVDSPRMLFELFEVVEDVGIGVLMTEFLGERPLLSAHKCTLRRVPPDLEVISGWHQDGAFLGDRVGAFNFWLSLSRCGQDAPGLDLVPARIDQVLQSDDESRFDWSLSDAAVLRAAAATPIVRPEFEPGDALLFDHLLVHRTAASSHMTRERHAIESWFFAPSSYPSGQLPVLF